MTTQDHPLHVAACHRLELDPGYGSVGQVADALGVRQDSYSRALSRGSLDTLIPWALRLGIAVIVTPYGAPVYLARPIECAQAARVLVARVVTLSGVDHPTARYEVSQAMDALGDVVAWLDVDD